METWEVIKKKCPECGAELHVNLMYCNKADKLCKVRYHCDCGWWVCMEKIPLKDVVRGRKVMDDLISRQDAIEAIVNTVSDLGNHDNSEVARFGAAFRQLEIIGILQALPSAEPSADKCWGCNCPKMRGEEDGSD